MFSKLDNPSTLPTGQGKDAKFSHDDTYLAVAHSISPYITIYKRSGDVFTKLDNPDDLPTDAKCLAWSHDSTYLAVGINASPYIYIYKRSGDTFTKLTNPDDLPSESVDGLAWSHDSTYLYAMQTNLNFARGTMYKRSGDTFTEITAPKSTGVSDAGFSHDSTYFAITRIYGSYIYIYKLDGDTFNKLDDPANLPNASYSLSWSHDSTYLSIGQTNGIVFTYKRSGDTFTKLANPTTAGSGTITNLDYSYDSVLLACVQSGSPEHIIYSRSGDVLTKFDDLDPTVSGTDGSTIAFSNTNNRYIAFAHTASPYINIYLYKLTVTTQAVTEIKNIYATGNGNITDEGLSNITERGFEFGESEVADSSVKLTGSDLGTGAFAMTISPLKPETLQYCRAWAENIEGVMYGDWVSFTTTASPSYGLYEESNSKPDSETGIYANSNKICFYVRKVGGEWGMKYGPYIRDQADIAITQILATQGKGKYQIKFISDVLTGLSVSIMIKLDIKAR